jgi:hypothetical protein
MTPERRDDLLAARALGVATPEELAELRAAGHEGDTTWDAAAAAAALALAAREPMPSGLAEKLLASAPGAHGAGDPEASAGAASRGTPGPAAPVTPSASGPLPRPARPHWARRAGLAWAAAAAAVALAVASWLRPPAEVVVERVVQVSPPPPPAPPAAREALLREAPDAVTIAWSATPDPAARGAGGDVVWSGARQAGYMRIRGLAPNDPGRAQYQLWIFDAERDDRYPVDGGVFDVRDGEAVVPIRAAVAVARPKLFAVTVERPGGVVVSSRERIVLAAAVP